MVQTCPLRWSKFRRQSVLTSHYEESQKLTPVKITLKISYFLSHKYDLLRSLMRIKDILKGKI